MANEVEIRVTSKNDTRKGFADAEKDASKFGDTLKKLGSAAAVGFAAAGVAAVAFGKEAISEASDLNETINKTRVIFGKNADDILKWSKSSATAFGLSRNEALGYASNLGNMLDQLGFTDEATKRISKSTVKFAADLGSFHNLPTGDVLERINAAMRGEYDSLQSLIPNINAARVEQVALARTGKDSADQLTAQEKAAATLAIIHKDGAKAAGDFARTSGSLANQQKILAAQTDNFQAKIGKLLLPIMVKLMGFLTTTVMPGLFRFSTWFQKEAIPAIREFAAATREKLQPVIDWVVEHWPEIQKTISQVFKRVVSDVKAFIDLVVKIWKKWGDDILRFAKVYFDSIKNQIQGALKIIRGIIDVITGLIKGDWSRVWRGIKEITDGVWQLIKNAIATPLKAIREIIRSAWDAVKDLTKRAFDRVRDQIAESVDAWRDRIDGAVDKIKAIFGALKDAVRSIPDAFRAAKDGIANIWDRVKRIAASPVNFIINKVYNSGIRKVVNALPDPVPDLPEIDPITFRRGGYTGNGSEDQIVGGVHGKEFVINARSTRQIERTNPGFLDRLNKMGLLPGHKKGGFVNPMQRVYVDGEPLTAIHAAQLVLAGKLMGVRQHVMQGSWQAPSSYSGTSHTGPGVADTSPGSFRAQYVQRRVGIAAWARNIPGAAYAGSGAHVHGVSMFSAPGNSQLAAYKAGGDGLGGRDYGARPGLLPNLQAKLSDFGSLVMSGLGGILGSVLPWKQIGPPFRQGMGDVAKDIKGMQGKGGWAPLYAKFLGNIWGMIKDWGIDKLKALASKPKEWWEDWASGFTRPFDSGGTLHPGWNAVYNGTGRPEHLKPTNGAGATVIEIHSGGSRLDDALVEILRKSIRVKGGNVQVVLGS